MNDTTSERYRRLSRQFSEMLDDVPDDAWSAPTPCAGWDVRDVLRHVVDTNRDFLGRHVELDPATGDLRADWESVRTLTQEVLDDGRGETQFEGYFGPTTVAEVIDRFYGMDLLVHRWDIARAAGLDAALTGAELDLVEQGVDRFGDALYMDGICRPGVTAPTDADRLDQVLATLGRVA